MKLIEDYSRKMILVNFRPYTFSLGLDPSRPLGTGDQTLDFDHWFPYSVVVGASAQARHLDRAEMSKTPSLCSPPAPNPLAGSVILSGKLAKTSLQGERQSDGAFLNE